MKRAAWIIGCILGFFLIAAESISAADSPDDSIISRTADGQVILRSRRPSGGVADFLPYAPDELLVRFKDDVAPTAKSAIHGRHKAMPIKRFRHTRNLELVKLPQGADLHRALKSYRDQREVFYAEPNYLVEPTSVIISNPGTPPPVVIPNDPSFPLQWNLHNTGQDGGTPGADIKAAEAWSITTGSNDVVVAVIDSGIDYNHQDLAANMWRNEADCNNNGIDDDGNGYIDDCYGIDTFNDDSDPMDDNDHGTHVAGIIGAVGNNGLGVVGVNWNVKIMSCKFMGADGYGTVADAIDCLEYVQSMKDRGVNIVTTNNSWGSYAYSQALYDAIDAQRAKGILFIAAAGNDGEDNDLLPLYPAAYYLPNVISVGAVDSRDNRAGFSNWGDTTIHMSAPGVNILSSTIGNTYAIFSGTSMSTPHVAGVAALLKAHVPGRDWKTIKNLLLAGGDSNSFLVNASATGKRLHAFKSLTCANSVVQARLMPRENQLSSGLKPVSLASLHINCGNPNGEVSVVVNPGNQVVVLKDDGIAPDQEAGDGIYSGQWIPSSGGNFTISFPDGDQVNVFVDEDLEPGFPVKTLHTAGTYQEAPIHTLVANIDDDPNLEIVVTGLANGPLYAWKSDGSPVRGWPVPTSGAAYAVASELSAQDQGSEVFAVHYYDNVDAAYSGSGRYLPSWPQYFGGIKDPVAADLDGDGVDEIIMQANIHKADGSLFSGWPFGEFVGTQLAVADLDGDGELEIISTGWGRDMFAHHQDGTPVNGFPVPVMGSVIGLPAVGDVDGDGKPEIVVVGTLNGLLSVMIVSNTGVIKRTMQLGGTVLGFTAPALADLDGDGIPEIIVQTGQALYVYRGDGIAFPGWPISWGDKYWLMSAAPVVGDVDGDGLPDIVVITSYAGNGEFGEVRVYNRNGTLHERFPKLLTIGDGAVPAIADIDLDGRNEIVVTGQFWIGREGYFDHVWVFDLGGPPHGAVQWGQFMGGPKHQGVYKGPYYVPSRSILNVRKEGAGTGTVTSDLAGINCGSDCSETYNGIAKVNLTAVASAGSVFVGWSGGGCTGTGKCAVTVTSDTNITAIFRSETLTTSRLNILSLNPVNGVTVSVTPSDDNGSGAGNTPFDRLYNYDISVTLTAPETVGGTRFQKWLRDGAEWANTASTQVLMAGDHTMIAVYSDPIPPDTTITGGPTGTVTGGGMQFTWTGMDNVTPTEDLIYVYRLDGPAGYGGNFQGYNSATSWWFGVGNGTYTFSVAAIDKAGNIDPTPATRTFTVKVDTEQPQLAITSHTNDETVTTNTIILSGTASDAGRGDNGISSVTITDVFAQKDLIAEGGTAAGSETANWSRPVTLIPGQNRFLVAAKDNSGSQNRTVAAININYEGPDTTGPNLLIKSHMDNQIVATSPVTITGWAWEYLRGDSGISSVTVNGIEANNGTATGPAVAQWSSQPVALSLGANIITVVATDNSPNRNSTTKQITLNYKLDQAPVVDAGPDKTIASLMTVLEGRVIDDGLPSAPGRVTTRWTKVSGPGTVTFWDDSALNATAIFSSRGTYVLRLTANDGATSVSDDATIIVDPPAMYPLVFVEPSGICNGNTPCLTSVQQAIALVDSGGSIRVAEGVYRESLVVNSSKKFKLEGGWKSDFLTRGSDPATTVIDGDLTGDGVGDVRVFSIEASAGDNIDVTVDRFTIQNGSHRYGGGIFAFAFDGGTIELTLNGNIIRNNQATDSGGGLGLYGENWPSVIRAALINNMIYGNETGGLGGGIYSSSTYGSELTATLMNNTISRNVAAERGGGLRTYAIWGVSDLTITNSIIWSNTAGSGQDVAIRQSVEGRATVQSAYNDLGEVLLDPDEPGTYNDRGNNISADPLFMNLTEGDLRLGVGSLAIDAGTNTGAPSTDFEGDDRPQGSGYDMGADERFNVPMQPLQIATLPLSNGEVGSGYHSPLGINGGLSPYTIAVVKGSLPPGLSLGSPIILGTPTRAGTYKFTIQVTDQLGGSVSQKVQIKILKALAISTKSLKNGRVNRAYNARLTASGGQTPYAWSLVSGTVPDGLLFDPSNGSITGTPPAAGNADLTFQVSDALGGTSQRSLTLTIR